MNIDLRVPEWAYTFGFLQADGHLWRGVGQKGKLTVELQFEDRELLEKLQVLFPCSSTLSERCRDTPYKKGYHSCSLAASALAFRRELQRLGLPAGNKSVCVAPPVVPFSASDFFRGWVDADGSVGITGKGLPFVGLSTKSPFIASDFVLFCSSLTGKFRPPPKPNTRDKMYNMAYWKEDAQLLARTLYPQGCLALTRKKMQAEKVSEWQRPSGMRCASPRKSWSPEEDSLLFNATLSLEALLRMTGRTERSVRARRWRLGSSGAPSE